MTGAAGALALAVALLATLDRPVEASTTWVDLGGLRVTLGVRLDGAAALVAVAVGAVALAVQVYSIGYLKRGPHDDVDVDHRYPPYAAQISLFTAAMLLVVVAGDLLLLLVGWEVMGICSYLLIAHDRRLPEAPAAAMKAFLVTRVGDVGFLLGIALLGVSAGSFRIADVLAHDHSTGTLTAACLLLLAGVAGKSAQFPLHTWLPDAMAGPTPISALIHAATMVAAGVYAVTRLYPLFEAAPVALTVLGVLASITLLLGALAATAQDDIKRVLAWSTVSQIGYMTGALAVGAPGAALFHLLTHAAFKALLFLAAGAVIHAVGTTLMSRMGGLRRGMPVTFWCTVVGLGALAGLPPLAGFWSKDGVLAAAQAAALDGEGPTPPGWAGSSGWPGWPASRSPPGTPPGCCCARSWARRASRSRTRTIRRGRCAGRWCCSPYRPRCWASRASPARSPTGSNPRRRPPRPPVEPAPRRAARPPRAVGGAAAGPAGARGRVGLDPVAPRSGRRPGGRAGSAAAGLRRGVPARRRPARPRRTPRAGAGRHRPRR